MEKSKLPSTKAWLQQFERPFLTIACGDWSYGKPKVYVAEADLPRRLNVGRYCSIGENVQVYVGRQGRHLLHTLTTYPIAMELDVPISAAVNAQRPWMHENLDVSIGDDVWIGSGALLMAGVTIGSGAVVGAGAVVTRNVPPYAIAVGNPAKPVKYRHDEQVIDALLTSRWWELNPDQLWAILGDDVMSPDMSRVTQKLIAFRGGAHAAGTQATPALQAQNPAPVPVASAPDASARNLNGPLRDKSLEDLYAIFSNGTGGPFPTWPNEELQRKFTGGFGVSLLRRAENFIDALQQDNAFQPAPWRGLDYGCGWGRIASYMLKYGPADQLDLCDALASSIKLAKDAGFKNKIFQTSELVKEGEIENGGYTFCYAMSIFTHLSKDAIVNNIDHLMKALAKGGKLYFTLRHVSFFDKMKELGRAAADAKFDSEGFWFMPYPGRPHYGETAVTETFTDSLAQRFGECVYLGSTESEQHLYRITR